MPKFRPDQIVKALPQPIHGVVRSIDRSNPDPQSAISSLNVLPYGPWDGFRRVTTRPDTSVFGDLSTSTDIQGLLPIGFVIQPGGTIAGSSTYNLLDLFGISSGFGVSSTYGPVTFNIEPGAPIMVSVTATGNGVTGGGGAPPQILLTAKTVLGTTIASLEVVTSHTSSGNFIESEMLNNGVGLFSVLCSTSTSSGGSPAYWNIAGGMSFSVAPTPNNADLNVVLSTYATIGYPPSASAVSTVVNHCIPLGTSSYTLTLEVFAATDGFSNATMS